jgi:hypothetical protein
MNMSCNNLHRLFQELDWIGIEVVGSNLCRVILTMFLVYFLSPPKTNTRIIYLFVPTPCRLCATSSIYSSSHVFLSLLRKSTYFGLPITVAARSKTLTVSARSNMELWVRIPLEAWMSVRVYCVCVVLCIGLRN